MIDEEGHSVTRVEGGNRFHRDKSRRNLDLWRAGVWEVEDRDGNGAVLKGQG